MALRVQPGARRTALLARLASGEWKVAVAAAPADGRANEAVAELLCGLLDVKRRQVALRRGASSRSKLFEVDGVREAECVARMSAALAAQAGKRTKGDAHSDGD